MEWFGDIPNQTVNDIRGKATQPDGNSGALKVKLGTFIPEANYNVIDTDYDSYAIVHTCDLFLGFKRMEFMWVLTRQAFEIGSE